MASNKVKFGLKRLAYSLITENSSGGVTTSSYGEITEIPGAVSISMTNSATKTVFRADDSDYYVNYGDGSIDGTITLALVPEKLKQDLGWVKRDDYDIAVESSDGYRADKYVALLFEFNGDQKATRHCLYKASLGRPNLASQTTGENGQPEVQTEEISVTAVPRADVDKYIHAYADDKTTSTAYDAWYTAVPVPTFTPNP